MIMELIDNFQDDDGGGHVGSKHVGVGNLLVLW